MTVSGVVLVEEQDEERRVMEIKTKVTSATNFWFFSPWRSWRPPPPPQLAQPDRGLLLSSVFLMLYFLFPIFNKIDLFFIFCRLFYKK